MSELKRIVKKSSAKKLRWKDGSVLVDVTTAGALLAVHDALNSKSRRKFSERVNTSLSWFNKLVTFSFKKVRLGK